MYKAKEKDQGRGGSQSLRRNQIVSLVYKPERTLSNILLEAVGLIFVLVVPYLLLLLV